MARVPCTSRARFNRDWRELGSKHGSVERWLGSKEGLVQKGLGLKEGWVKRGLGSPFEPSHRLVAVAQIELRHDDIGVVCLLLRYSGGLDSSYMGEPGDVGLV